MSVDVEALIVPVADDNPAGPDMSYHAARQEIESAFERSISDDSTGGAEADWRETIRQIETQATETRDIWLPVYLMRAGAKAGQLDTVESGAELLAGLLENLWGSVHPQLDDYGFQGRKGPCESLTRLSEFLNPFRDVVLLDHPRLGSYSARDFERFRENGASEEGYGMFRALIEETSDEDLQAIVERISGITNSIRRVDVVLVAKADGDTGTNFQPTYEMLEQVRKGVAAFLQGQPEGDAEAISGANGAGYADAERPAGPNFSGGIDSREDVVRAMDAIADYYKRKEPGSPVPFALRRARVWVSLDFLEVLEDIAPNSLDEARRVLVNGREPVGDDHSDSSSGSEGWG